MHMITSVNIADIKYIPISIDASSCAVSIDGGNDVDVNLYEVDITVV